jgi:hypothetical protein
MRLGKEEEYSRYVTIRRKSRDAFLAVSEHALAAEAPPK